MILTKENQKYLIKFALNLGAETVVINSVKKEKSNIILSINSRKKNKFYENGTSIFIIKSGQNYNISTNINDIGKICSKIKNVLANKNKIMCKFEKNSISSLSNHNFSQLDDFDYAFYAKKIKSFSNKYKEILNIELKLLQEKKQTQIMSSDGKDFFKTEYYYKLDILMSALINNEVKSNYYSTGVNSEINSLKNNNLFVLFENLYSSLKNMSSLKNIHAYMPVVLASGIGGVILHEACGHSLESREIVKDKSILSFKSNIGNSNLTLIDNPTLNGLFGSFEFDDEGNKSMKTELIKNGTIVNYLIDVDGSKKLYKKNTSSGRRESYYNMMSSRMSNTFIQPGKYNINEMISKIEYGIYVKNIVGGVVDTISGNFSFNCIESYLIIKGKIDYSKSYNNLTIVGNTIDLLKNISMIGNDLKHNCGICGSESGFIYTTVGQPTIKIDKIYVEGF